MPLIGCASHNLNLAVDFFVDQAIYAPLVTKGSNLMTQLRTLKNAGKLRRHGLLMTVIPNATRRVHFLSVCFIATHTILI